MGASVQDTMAQQIDGVGRDPRIARRNPWIAGCLSFNAPGVGQLYNGQPAKGFVLWGLGWGVFLAALAMLLWIPMAPWIVVIPVLMILSSVLYVPLDAALTACRHGHAYHLKAYNRWY